MSDTKKDQIDRITRYADLIQKQTGKAVRPYRADGYVNLMNKYGTSKDASEQYRFVSEGIVDDDTLSVTYEGNGLFSRIIDTPAEEAVKHGFTLKNINDESVEEFYMSALDELDWDETAITCLKWARLFGGSLAVMLINDGRGVDEPLDWRNIKSIDDIRVYDRSVVQPDYSSMYSYDPRDPFNSRGSRFGMPEYYYVSSVYGSFTVHESRCLVFQNGVLPERTSNSVYRLWGMPEYVRIHRAMRDAEIAHGSAVKMLDRSVQAVYKMKDLAMELATEEGENRVLRRLQIIDMARGLLNSITIDGEGEDYDFRTFQFTGVSDIINATCNYLSALTSIPQTILFGRSPAGMNATGESDMETYYNFVERIQKRSLRSNLRYLLSVIFQAGVATGEIEKVPNINVQFNPLWSMSDAEKADLELKNAQAKQTKAATASLYIQEQVLSAEEVRESLVKSGDFDVDATFDDDEDEESMAEMIQKITENGGFAPNSGGSSPDAAPAATKLPQDMNDGDLAEASVANAQSEQEPTIGLEAEKTDDAETPAAGKGNLGSVGVLVIKDGKILVAVRKHDVGNGLICGPGGHIEPGETPIMAAARETIEEFGIIPNELIPIGNGPAEPETGFEPYIFLCTDYDGTPVADGDEMSSATFLSLEELEELSSALFAPFADSLKVLLNAFGGEDRKDAADDDIDWITVNGTHIPLDEAGKAIGGPDALKGKEFHETGSEGKEEKQRAKEKKPEEKPARKTLGGKASPSVIGAISDTGRTCSIKVEKDGETYEIRPNGMSVNSKTGEYFTEEESREIIAGSTLSNDNPPEVYNHVEFSDSTQQKINRVKELKEKLDTGNGFNLNDADEYSRLRTEICEEAKSCFQSPDDCLTSSDAAWYLTSKGYFQEPGEDNDYVDENDIGEFNGIEAAVAKDCVSAIDGIFADYPMLRGKLKGFRTEDDVPKYNMQNAYASSHHEYGVVFSSVLGASKNILEKSYDRSVKNGFHPKGTSGAKAIVEHEYAHQIQDYIEDELGVRYGSVADEIVEKAARRIGKSAPEVANDISQYALENHSELIAEAWCEYRCSPSPRPTARLIGEMFEQYFGGGKK